jgi:aryl-alcohol dehydrogenase-like predicted oxidoreductase
MHRDDLDYEGYESIESRQTPVDTILAALSDQQIRNKYTWIGISNWETERVNKALHASDKGKNVLQPVITSPYFSLFEMDEEEFTIHSGGVQVTHDEMMDEEFQHGIKIMPYSPLGGFNIVERGWEKAKEAAMKLDKSGDRYWGNVWEAIFDEKNEKRYHRAQEVLQQLNDLSHGQNYTLDQLLHAYVLAHPRVDLLAVGPLKPEHLSRTVQSLSLADRLKNYPAILDYLYNGTNKQDAFRNLDTEFI